METSMDLTLRSHAAWTRVLAGALNAAALLAVGCGADDSSTEASGSSSPGAPVFPAPGNAAIAGSAPVAPVANPPLAAPTAGAPAAVTPVPASTPPAVTTATPQAGAAAPVPVPVTTPPATTPPASVNPETKPVAPISDGTPGPDGYMWPSDCEQRFSFTAHGQPGAQDKTKYEVPAGSEYYASFMFQAPWGADEVQGLKFRSVIDNPKVVHHWILYGVDSATIVDGDVQGGIGQLLPASLPGEAFIQGWAPGGPDAEMPANVGLHMPRGATAAFRLEVHYNNLAGTTAQGDASGVEFCVSSHKRTEEAAVHWLGTANFSVPAHSQKDVVSTCKPNVTRGPVHIMSVSPHMHKIGAHATAIINRADGSKDTLIDLPFDFADQRAYTMPMDGSSSDVLLNAGDTITTTCGFDNTTAAPISFGSNTADEMCFFFTLAWPRGQLANGTRSFIPGAETTVNCLQ